MGAVTRANAAAVALSAAQTLEGASALAASEAERVYVAPSTLLPHAGLGLFAARDFAPGEVLSLYDGELVDRGTALARDPSHMRVVLLHCMYIDGLRAPLPQRGWGSFANDPRGTQVRANACYALHTGARGAATLLPCVVLRATRAVKRHDEVLVSYGSSYWARMAHASERVRGVHGGHSV